MLVQKSVQKTGVTVLKLSNNDEIMANIISQDDYAFVVENPCILVLDNNGKPVFAPMLVMGEAGTRVPIYKHGVVATSVPAKNLLVIYEQTFAKVIMPTRQGIII